MIGRKPDGDLSAGGESELVKDVADMGIHGPDRNVEFCRDVMVTESDCNFFGNFALPGTE